MAENDPGPLVHRSSFLEEEEEQKRRFEELDRIVERGRGTAPVAPAPSSVPGVPPPPQAAPGIPPPAMPQMPEAATEAPAPAADFSAFDNRISGVPQQAPAPEADELFTKMDKRLSGEEVGGAGEPSAGEEFTAGLQRTWHSMKAAPEAFKAQIMSLAGDQAGADAIMKRLAAEEAAAGIAESKESLERTWNDPSRIGRYLAKVAGEQAPNLIAGIAMGGLGGLGALGARALVPVLARWSAPTIATFGATTGVVGSGVVQETAGIGEDIYKATGTTHGGKALGFGTAAGALEGVGGITGLGKALIRPGRELAVEGTKKAFGKEVLKTAAGESAQELGQEEAGIQALALATAGQKNPYDAWGKEAMWRRAEAGFLGGLFGGTIGVPGVYAETRQGPAAADTGFRKTYRGPVQDLDNATRTVPEIGTIVPKELDKTLPDVMHPVKPAEDDLLNLSGQLKTLFDESGPGAAAFREVLEANTERFAVVDAATGSGPGRVLTDTDVEQRLALLPQGEKLKVVKVAQDRLDLREVTADVFDLAPASSGKVWFLPEVDPAARQGLLAEYDKIQRMSEAAVKSGELLENVATEAARREQLEKAMRPLHAAGLRVVPSYGRSFQYNGSFDGTEVVPTTSGRTKQLGVFDPATGKIKLPGGRLWQTEAVGKGVPVALDLRRFKPGEVSGVPMKSDWQSYRDVKGWKFAEGVSEAKKKELFDWLDANSKPAAEFQGNFEAPTPAQMKQVMKEGMWFDVTKESYSLVLKEGIDPKKFTYGIRRDRADPMSGQLGEEESSLEARTKRYARLQREESSVSRNIWGQLTPDEELMATRLENEAKKYLSKLDRLMRMLGMPGGIKILITNTQPTATVPELGEVYFNPEGWVTAEATGFSTGNFEVDFNSTLLHEIGHVVTLNLYGKLSVQEQLQLKAAYNRALLADRLQAENVRQSRTIAEYAGTTGGELHTRYYQSFAEWLAEQFRRHSRTNAEIRNEFEVSMPEVAKGIESFYQKWVKLTGPQGELNLRHPDHFLGLILDKYQRGEKNIAPLRELEQMQQVWRLADGINWSETSQEVMKTVVDAVNSLAALNVVDVPLVLSGELTPQMGVVEPGAAARVTQTVHGKVPESPFGMVPGTPYWSKSANPVAIIELAINSLKTKEAYSQSREIVSRAWMHSYMQLGLLSEEEIKTLANAAIEAGQNIDSATRGMVRLRADQYARELGLDAVAKANYEQRLIERMLAADFVGEYARTGKAPKGVRALLDRILAVLRAIQDRLIGSGFTTREQLLRAIFNGDIASRYKVDPRKQFKPLYQNPVAQPGGVMHGAANVEAENITRVVQVDDELHAYIGEYGGKLNEMPHQAIYYFYRGPVAATMEAKPEEDYVGYVELKYHKGIGYEVQMVEVTEANRRKGYGGKFHDFWSYDQGYPHKPSGTLTPDGYAFWKNKDPATVRYHVFDKNETECWLSPRKVDQYIRVYEQGLKANPNATPKSKQVLEAKLRYYRRLRERVNPKAWRDPDLKMMFSSMDAALDGVRASVTRGGMDAEARALEDALSGLEGSSADAFSEHTAQELQWSQAENAKELGIPFEEAAPQTLASGPVRKVIENIQGLDVPADVKKKLAGIAAEEDRIGHFSKRWWGLQQLAWLNEHIPGLQRYVQYVQQMAQRTTAWMTRADETARGWEKLPEKRRIAVGDMMFWLAEQRYRSAQEVANGVNRWPTPQELAAELKRRRITPTELKLIQRINDDFRAFLDEVERVSAQNIARTIGDPQVQAKALADLQAQMAAMRSKPYFPFVRFGRHTISVRDPSQNNKVIWFSAYDSPAERNRALRTISSMPAHRGMDITYGRVPEEASQFMGLPAPLISYIKDNMDGLSQVQKEWLDDFAASHLPGNSFRRRWLKKEGTPGFSMDAFRSYAHYFMQGSKFLARMEYDGLLQESITDVEKTTRGVLKNAEKRQMIVDYMRKHYKYITSNARDFSKTRAFIALWQLGFSFTAAGMNLTQIPFALSPYLRSTFGVASTRTIQSTLKQFRRGATTKGLSPGGVKAREELIRQNRIEVGQAAELASFAEGQNLVRLMAGTKLQRAYRQFSYYGMLMFSKVEQFNREITFRSAWELAMKNPNAQRLREIGFNYPAEIADLIQRLQITHEEAVAFLYAREAIDRTQGNYAPWAKSPFLRNRWAGLLGIFFQYMQTMIYAMRHNGAMVQMLLIGLLFYGLQGAVPGGEDFIEVVKTLGWWFFGKDWDVYAKAREFTRDLTRGTIFDEVGPDLMMHGISRYGFGVGLLPEGWGMPRFDVSANGSMGKVVPGLSDTLRKMRWTSDWEGAVASAAQGVGGAGMGPMFALMQWLLEPPGTTDSKRWEGAAQRGIRDISKSYRYATEGETSRQGGRLIQFDMRDPDDVATVVAQALGARPTVVSEFWEHQRAFADQDAIYKSRKLILYAQMDEAVRAENKEAVDTVKAAMRRFNEDAKANAPSHIIDDKKVEASLRARERTRRLQEAGQPLQKSSKSVFDRTLDMYPGLVKYRQKVQ